MAAYNRGQSNLPDINVVRLYSKVLTSRHTRYGVGTDETPLTTTSPLTATPVPPRPPPSPPPPYNGYFFWRTVHTFTLVSTSLQWPLFSVPRVIVVERFNCTFLSTAEPIGKKNW